MSHPEVTLSDKTIHNPSEPRHFMRVKPVGRHVRVLNGDTVLARSDNAAYVIEVGRDVYDPVIYFPRADIVADVEVTDRSSHCPLKGDATYFRLKDAGSSDEIAWSYESPLEFADAIKGLVGFYTGGLTIEIGPSSS